MITILIGRTGCGKTSLGACFAIRAMDNGAEALKLYYESMQAFPGFLKVKPPKNHLTYSDIYVYGSETSNVRNETHFTTGYKIGLPNSDFEIDYFPYGSTIVLDETRKYWPARKSMSGFEAGGTHDKVLEFFELSRQGGLDIYLIMHMVNQVDVQIRGQAHRVLAPETIEFIEVGKKLKSIITVWKGYQFNSIQDYEASLTGGVKGMPFEIVFNGDIRDCYDTNYYRFRFFEGLRKYSCVKVMPCDGTRASVNKLSKMFESCVMLKSKKGEISNGSTKFRRANITYL